MNKYVFLVAFIAIGFWQCESKKDEFVKISGLNFVIDDQPYRFIGANYWYGMNLGMEGEHGDRERLIKELDDLQQLGVTNLRILGSSEGEGKFCVIPASQPQQGIYDEDVLAGLDFFLNEMSKRNMKAVFVLNNFWMWSGGFPQYVSWADGTEIPYPPVVEGGSWDGFINYALSFYSNEKAQKMFEDHIKVMINRKNTINGLSYKDDPTIMAWQLSNEPRGYSNVEGHRKWIKKTAKYIKGLDTRHLVCVGSEGNTSSDHAGVDLFEDNNSTDIDYATVHVWIQNWSWFNPQYDSTFETSIRHSEDYLADQLAKASKLNKPVVIEEFGVSRDKGIFEKEGTTQFRDRYYEFIFDFTVNNIKAGGLVQGCNFWSYGGYGRSTSPGGIWKIGDDLIGDPPHEFQGWYSVYDTDKSTLGLIRSYNQKLIETTSAK